MWRTLNKRTGDLEDFVANVERLPVVPRRDEHLRVGTTRSHQPVGQHHPRTYQDRVVQSAPHGLLVWSVSRSAPPGPSQHHPGRSGQHHTVRSGQSSRVTTTHLKHRIPTRSSTTQIWSSSSTPSKSLPPCGCLTRRPERPRGRGWGPRSCVVLAGPRSVWELTGTNARPPAPPSPVLDGGLTGITARPPSTPKAEEPQGRPHHKSKEPTAGVLT